MATNVLVVKSLKAPAAPGVHHRLMCMTGENKGICYFIKSNRVVLGRGENADIKVLDVKSSREHAEITKFKKDFVLTDLGSQNGIVVNDLKVVQHRLKDGDKIIIGQTVYKYSILDVKNILDSKGNESKVENKSKDDDEEDIDEPENKKSSGKTKLIIVVVVLVIFFTLGGEEEESVYKKTSTSGRKTKDISNDLSEVLRKKKNEEDKELTQKLDAIIHSGQRELREGNYFRAIEEFNLALVLSPNNGRASFYLSRTKKALDDEIESYFLKARREYDSLRYRDSGVSYCTIMRLLESYPDDPRFLRAKDQIKLVEKSLGMFEGDFKCFEE